jgi:DNA-binding transcriptional LysR family regulator
VNLDAVHTFVVAADAGQFQYAAIDLSLTQQAVSKRITALENDLGVRLFTRTARGVRLTGDGEAFLPYARELLRAAERAAASVRPGRRALRVDVISRKIAPGALLRGFHRAHPDTALELVTLTDAATAVAAVAAGEIDATFRAVTRPLPDGVTATRVLDEAHMLLTGPGHELAAAGTVTLARLVGYPIWMPGIVPGTEWATYYDDLAAAFGLTIDPVGPNFGTDSQLDALAESPTLATLVGDQTRLLWPAEYDLRRIPVRDPTPVYPHSLVWRTDNPHPALAALRRHVGVIRPAPGTWAPAWAASQGRDGGTGSPAR